MKLLRRALNVLEGAEAGVALSLAFLAVVGVVRDLKRRRLSWLSAALAALWTVCIVYVAARLVLTG